MRNFGRRPVSCRHPYVPEDFDNWTLTVTKPWNDWKHKQIKFDSLSSANATRIHQFGSIAFGQQLYLPQARLTPDLFAGTRALPPSLSFDIGGAHKEWAHR
jgi:hypothetical protein